MDFTLKIALQAAYATCCIAIEKPSWFFEWCYNAPLQKND